VAIVGGGVAGLEMLFALEDLAGDRVAVTLLAPTPEFVYKPLTVQEPFSPEPATRIELEPLVNETGGTFLQWWPPHKIAGRYLSARLEGRSPDPLG
jgi:sulfide:quinone oxidoreductase